MPGGGFFRFFRRRCVRVRGAPVSRLEQESACRGGAAGVAGVDDVFEAVVVGFGDLPVGVFEEEQGEYEDAGDGKCDEYGHSVVHDGSFPLCVRADVTHFQDYCVLYGFCFGFF